MILMHVLQISLGGAPPLSTPTLQKLPVLLSLTAQHLARALDRARITHAHAAVREALMTSRASILPAAGRLVLRCVLLSYLWTNTLPASAFDIGRSGEEAARSAESNSRSSSPYRSRNRPRVDAGGAGCSGGPFCALSSLSQPGSGQMLLPRFPREARRPSANSSS